MIKAILIDIDDTLLDFKLCSEQAILKACSTTGVSFNKKLTETFSAVTAEYWKKIEKGELTKLELRRDRFNEVFRICGIDFNGEKFEKIYLSELFESNVTIEGAKELLEILSKRYKLCAASNAPYAQQINRLTKAGLLPYFSEIFVSEKIGAEKPSSSFFDYVLEALKLPPNEILIIGDSITADISGGLACGMHTCHFARKKTNTPTEIRPEYSVNNLLDILKLSVLA